MLAPKAPSDFHMQTSSQQVPNRANKAKIDVTPQKPNGVLAVHLKELRIMNGDFIQSFDHEQVNLYVRIIVGGNIKSSCINPYTHFPSTVCLDDLKHFFIQINPTRGHNDNNIRMELVGFDRRDVHRVLSRKVIHSHELVKNQFVVDTCKFVRAERVFAEVDAEYCFSYGAFGYGYSNQLENSMARPRDQITHSMFCRCAPPPDRTRGRGAPDVMASIPVGHPAFINFTGKAELVDLKTEFGEDKDIKQFRMIEDPMILISKMRKRMHLLQEEFSSQPSRKKRILYLKKLIRNDHLMADDSDEICLTQGSRMRRRVANADPNIAPQTSSTAVSATGEAEDSSFNVKDINRIMALAPGVIEKKPFQEQPIAKTRARRRSVMPFFGRRESAGGGSYELLEAITVKNASSYTKNPDLMIESAKPDERRASTWTTFQGVFKATRAFFARRRDSAVEESARKDSVVGEGADTQVSQSRKDSIQEDEKQRRASTQGKSRKDSIQEDEEEQSTSQSRKDSVTVQQGEKAHNVADDVIVEEGEELEEPEASTSAPPPSDKPVTSRTSVTTDVHKVNAGGKRRSTLSQLARFIFGGSKPKEVPANELTTPRLTIAPPSPIISSDEDSDEDVV